MAYVVTEAFTDSNLNSVDENGEKHVYWEGDTYPYLRWSYNQAEIKGIT